MALWTDVIEPAELTGYMRERLDQLEADQQTVSLAQWLPNRLVPDIVARFRAGSGGYVDEARWRAYDAEPEIGKGEGWKRVTLDLPAIGRVEPVSEYTQLRTRNASDAQVEDAIVSAGNRNVIAVFNAVERLRGIVLATGRATINQDNFDVDDNFGRSATHQVTAAALWTDPAVDRLADLQAWSDVYEASNGVAPGAILMSRQVFRALQAGNQFQTQLVNGGARPPTDQEVRDIVEGAGLPPIHIYTRRTTAGPILPADTLLLLPAPTTTTDTEYELGGTFWGQTLTSIDPDYGLADTQLPGVVGGVYRNEKPPMIAEVISDGISLPVLANANLSFAAKVL